MKTATSAMKYERTGKIKSDRNVVERGVFKDLKTSNIVVGSIAELYRRYSTEVWAALTVGTWVIIIWGKLN